MQLDAADMNAINALFQGHFDRIEKLIAGLVPRPEYEQFKESVNTRVSHLEGQLTSGGQMYFSDQDKLRQLIEKKIEKLEVMVNGVNTKVEQINDRQNVGRGETLRQIATVVGSFLFGGGLIALLEYLRALTH
jgi:hypothetical protein